MTMPICLWSGPRNVSTALMYSFRELSGIQVIDEPLYGHYLRVTDAPHPGRNEVMQCMDCDGNRVMQSLLQQQHSAPSPRLFLKHMAHHLVELDLKFLRDTCNVLLVRDPKEMLPSLSIQLPQASLADTGLKRQWQLFSELADAGRPPQVLDSRELLLDPAIVLRSLCDQIDVDFDPEMLAWAMGPRAEDGVWAEHWYHAVHDSTGFARYQSKTHFPDHLQSLLDECSPWYERLYAHALRADASGETD
jgi:hypothetical protein